MDYLWAPWRMKFILENAKRKGGPCIFCELPKQSAKENFILYQDKSSYIVLNIYPYNTGHLLVIPKRHTDELGRLDPAEHGLLGQLLAESVRILRDVKKAEAFNIGMNLGHIGGAGIPHHLHYHVVPRWQGDSNFMTTVGNTKTHPESLQDVYGALEKPFNAIRLKETL